MLEGLEPFARRELERLGAHVEAASATELRLRFGGPPAALAGLRRAVAAYRLERFDVPRPKALLGDRHLRRLLALLGEVRDGAPFEGFRLSAAGADSPAFRRLATALAEGTGLRHDPEEGELLVRVRPAPDGEGWEVLPRLTPRPLSARAWRVCNRGGGLNAAVAAAGTDLLGVHGDDRYLNLMCGSGTLLVERARAGDARALTGADRDPEALACARRNLDAAGLTGVELREADATRLPWPDASFDALAADPPWGDDVGSHEENARLYPAFLREARRLAAPGARLLVVTHEIRLLDRVLAEGVGWRETARVRVFHGGHRPAMVRLEPT